MPGPSLLFDSNVFFAAGVSKHELHQDAEIATRLMELAQKHDCPLFLAKATRDDIRQDQNLGRRKASQLRMRQWKVLEKVKPSQDLLKAAGLDGKLSHNDQVDAQVLATLNANAADFLVTQDRKLRQRAAQIGLGDRALSITGAIEVLEQLFGQAASFPTLEQVKGYQLDQNDPIFDSLRLDYHPDFDTWLDKVRKEHRDCYIVRTPGSDRLDALAILKIEEDQPHNLPGRVLKVCTFKVADHAAGAKRGELLLKGIFSYARTEDIDRMYVEVLPVHDSLVGVLGLFGFVNAGIRKAPMEGHEPELVLVKEVQPPTTSGGLDPHEFNRLYGPQAILLDRVFVVPIQPIWHNILFPEADPNLQLLAPSPAGNALLKAYLSASPITKMTRGATLLFYRSGDIRAVTAVGVVDTTFRSKTASDIRRFVGQRTVYTDSQIEDMCDHGNTDVLAIRFRHDRVLETPWPLDMMIDRQVVSAPPQTIQQVRDEGALEWITERLDALR